MPAEIVDWNYMVPKDRAWFNVTEMPLVHCELGQAVKLQWNISSLTHDVYELYSYEAYVDCNFKPPAQSRANAAHVGDFEFTCSFMGTRFFACSVNDACSRGKQRVRVHGVNSSKTASIRANNESTLAEYMKEAVKAYSTDAQKSVPEAEADRLEEMLMSIASNSPASCADWMIPSHLSNTTCLAYVYTDLGVLYRQRAVSDLQKSQHYYGEALKLIPNLCLAQSYLVELQIKLGNRTGADAQFESACAACGSSDLDMEIIRMAYLQQGWDYPANSACGNQDSSLQKTSTLAPTTTQIEFGDVLDASAAKNGPAASLLKISLITYFLTCMVLT